MELHTVARPAAALMLALAITACGNRDAGTAPGEGMLEVIVNTPIARAGSVAIRGPAASSAHVEATDTLRGLTPGQYSAHANDAAAPDSLVSPVLTGVMSDSAVMVEVGVIHSVTATYNVRGGSGAMWVGKWGSVNLAEGFTSPQLATAGTATAADTIGTGAIALTISGTAFDAQGNLWVTDYINQQLLKFTPAQLASGESTPAVAILTSKEPWGIAFDGDGNLWVSYYNGNYVHEYAASDVAAWSGALTDPAPALSIPTPNGPLNIAFDASGNLWVAGFDVPVTYAISAAAIHAGGSVVSTDSLVSPYLTHGSGIAFDRAGNLWEGTESGFLVGYSLAQLGAAVHGAPVFAQLSPIAQFDQIAFDNAGNLWAATESADVIMYSPAQLTSGDISTGARTLTSAVGEESFGIAFDTHSSELPIASTISTSSHASHVPHSLAVHRAPPPVAHLHDGSTPGRVRR